MFIYSPTRDCPNLTSFSHRHTLSLIPFYSTLHFLQPKHRNMLDRKTSVPLNCLWTWSCFHWQFDAKLQNPGSVVKDRRPSVNSSRGTQELACVSCGCHDRSLQTWWLKTTPMSSLLVWEAKSLRWAAVSQSQDVGGAALPPKFSEWKIYFFPFFSS